MKNYVVVYWDSTDNSIIAIYGPLTIEEANTKANNINNNSGSENFAQIRELNKE